MMQCVSIIVSRWTYCPKQLIFCLYLCRCSNKKRPSFLSQHNITSSTYHCLSLPPCFTPFGCLLWALVVRMGTLAVCHPRPDPREITEPAVRFPPAPLRGIQKTAFQLKTSPVRCHRVAFGQTTHNVMTRLSEAQS